jgi:hypothetical protein
MNNVKINDRFIHEYKHKQWHHLMQLDFIEHIKFDIYNYYITNVCFPVLKEF